MPSAVSIGSGRRIDPQLVVAIRGPREEEFGARLSDTPYMNSTKLVGNPGTDMSAMHFCKGAEKTTNEWDRESPVVRLSQAQIWWFLEKKKASPEGRAKP
jgi:hypothetical protein